jgi:hypothetical protein
MSLDILADETMEEEEKQWFVVSNQKYLYYFLMMAQYGAHFFTAVTASMPEGIEFDSGKPRAAWATGRPFESWKPKAAQATGRKKGKGDLAGTEMKTVALTDLVADHQELWTLQTEAMWMQGEAITNFRYSLTLFSKSFASFPHGTCALSVSHQYLALDGIYHPIGAASLLHWQTAQDGGTTGDQNGQKKAQYGVLKAAEAQQGQQSANFCSLTVWSLLPSWQRPTTNVTRLILKRLVRNYAKWRGWCPAANHHSQTTAVAKTPQQLLFANAGPLSTNTVTQMDVDSSSEDNMVLLNPTVTNVVRPQFPPDDSDDKEQA